MSQPAVEEKEVINDIRNPDVVTKYKAAAEIANNALKHVIPLVVAGANIGDICKAGDDFIVAETGKTFKNKKDLVKGIAFPTCVSANNIVGNHCPYGETTTLADGDVVKIDLGAHFDGYAALVAHTVVVNASGAAVTGAKADLVVAAYQAAQVAVRKIRDGKTNDEVSKAIAEVASDFGVHPVVGVLGHNMEQFIMDGPNVICNKIDLEHPQKTVTFETNQVYTIDVVLSTSDETPKTSDIRTNVHKRDINIQYPLRVQAARSVLTQVDKKFPFFPFNIRDLDQTTARFGMAECVKNHIIEAYPVMYQKNSIVAQFKFTVLLMPNGANVITGVPVDLTAYQTDKTVTNAEFVDLLKTSLNENKKKNKKKAAAAAQE